MGNVLTHRVASRQRAASPVAPAPTIKTDPSALRMATGLELVVCCAQKDQDLVCPMGALRAAVRSARPEGLSTLPVLTTPGVCNRRGNERKQAPEAHPMTKPITRQE